MMHEAKFLLTEETLNEYWDIANRKTRVDYSIDGVLLDVLQHLETKEAEIARLKRLLTQLSTLAGMPNDERLEIVARALGKNVNTYNVAVRMKLCLEEYMREYPAFKSKPIGAPHSDARAHQKKMADLEVATKQAIRDWMEFDK